MSEEQQKIEKEPIIELLLEIYLTFEVRTAGECDQHRTALSQ
jgi:hypothetical protein